MSILRRLACGTGVALIGVAPLVAGVPVAVAGAAPESGQSASPSICRSSGPIDASSLLAGITTRGCRLVGRLVVSGDVSVRVPPAGMGVGASPVSGGVGSGSELQVSNFGGRVTATVDGSRAGTTSSRVVPSASARVAPAPCRDGRSTLEQGPPGHAWATTMHWRYNKKSTPGRMTAAAASRQFRLANLNVIKADNDCGLKGIPRVRSSYDGYTAQHPNIAVSSGSISCGKFNRQNTAAFGGLPGNYLGYTCYWWGSGGAMIAADMRIESAKRVVLKYNLRQCRSRFDLQSIATHEWGHAFGLGHVGTGQSRLTMSPLLPPCSYGPRSLGLGDWKGMKRLYGMHR